MDVPDEQTDRLHNALSEALSAVGMVNRWVVTAEIITEDGDRPVMHFASSGIMLWEVLGMTETAAAEVRAQIINDQGGE